MMDEASLDDGPRRRLSLRDQIDCVPVYVVWEITLACNLKCVHCGSRAEHRRARELSTSECIDVVRQLAELGTREISIIGGEAFVRKDWLTLFARSATMAWIALCRPAATSCRTT
jgi:MoaA/NifB/PqqE/SkfB family radical SAM enzyme